MISPRLYALNAMTALAVSAATILSGSAPASARDKNNDFWKLMAGVAVGAIAAEALQPPRPQPAPTQRYYVPQPAQPYYAPQPAPVYIAPPPRGQAFWQAEPVWQADPRWQGDRGGWDEDDDWRNHRRHRHHHDAPPVYYSQPGWTPWH